MKSEHSKNIKIPVLPLRDVVIYPHMVIPLFVGRKKSIKCIETSMNQDKKIMLIAQKKAYQDEPQKSDLFTIGTVSSILQMLPLPDGTIKVLIEGLQRASIKEFINKGTYFIAEVELIESYTSLNKEQDILKRAVLNQFESYMQLNKKIPLEILNILNSIKDIEKLADTIAAHIPLKLKEKQLILETNNINKRLELLISVIESEIDLLKLERNIRNRIKKQMEKSQKEYYLNEQMKAIQKELGGMDNILDEKKILKNKIKTSKMPKEARKKTDLELKKLTFMPSMSAEATVVRNYIDWMIQVPWSSKTKIEKNLEKAQQILDKDHFGLEKIKNRILEYLAVQSRTNRLKGPILCLIGPPGVGKTSLGKSIAKATGRKYIRMALGGMKDEAEIRGHRRTYIGSMPGKLMQNMIKVKVKNPLFLLDEIDKMSFDIRFDPVSALLEVLDPDQNTEFNDHYLEVDYDLSDVMFVATSNSVNIPAPLLDRMETIRLSGYTENEKLNIARKYLYPKQMKENAVKKHELNITECAMIDIIRYYTKESGVRNLEREISKICRKSVKSFVLNKSLKQIEINSKNLKKFLGMKRFNYEKIDNFHNVGEVIGLAWTEVGGELLTIETACVPGKGKLTHTGCLGAVMKESIQAALTVVRSNAVKLKIPINFHEKYDIHVHVPEGAIPKDGPSAGVAMCVSMISSLTKIPVHTGIAMTGEITLNGQVLAVGGLKEKLLAAHRCGIQKVLIPYPNKRNLKNIPLNIISGLKIYPVKNIQEVLTLLLEKKD